MYNTEPQKKEIQIQLDEETAQGVYSNLSFISSNQTEFVLDFIYVQPQQPKAKVRSRIIMSPNHAKKFLLTMKDSMKMWLAESHMNSKMDVVWEPTPYQPAPPGARGTGHGNLDYYPAADFAASIREDRSPELDVYGAAETAAPAVIAAMSAENGCIPLSVPDFRPDNARKPGQEPAIIDPGPSDLTAAVHLKTERDG